MAECRTSRAPMPSTSPDPEAAAATRTDDARACIDHGVILMEAGRLEEARPLLERACALAPDLAESHHALGALRHHMGELAAAIAEMRAAHLLAPDNAAIHSKLLFLLNYSADLSPAQVYQEHRRFGARHVQAVAPPAPDPAWPRRLRVGYLSPDFRSHVVTSFMLPVFARHDRARVEVCGYYTYPEGDEITAAMRSLADDWRDCAGMDDAELAARIRADRIDILVDLAGHSAFNRLPLFALRPAPAQVTWLGYPNTTGMGAIDYRVTDARADPPGDADRLHSERLVRLPRAFLCYRPGPDDRGAAPLPAASNGFVTFGCFNNFQKLSGPFFAAAARILAEVPGARLLLKARPLGTPSIAAAVRARFGALGIGAERLLLEGWTPSPEAHVAAYDRVDVALDTFPYNGTTTTCEALWKGAPVVALRGDRHAGRVGASLLAAAGLEDLVANDVEGYVRVAVALANDRPRLAALRAGLRERLRASPLRDEAGFVRELEDAYARIWEETRERASRPAPYPGVEEAYRIEDKSEAVDAIGRAMARDGESGRGRYLLGCALEELERFAEAAAAYRRSLELEPALAKAANNLGCMLELGGDAAGAARSYERAIGADAHLPHAHYNLANLARQQGRWAEAEQGMRRALGLEDGHPDWLAALAEVLLNRWKLDEALDCARRAAELDPDLPRAQFALANALLMLGRADEAEAGFRRAAALDPESPELHSNLLLALHYRKGDRPAEVYREHRAWAARHAAGLGQPADFPAIARTRDRRLNVGYVSPNFHRHSVASFVEPLFAAHDRARVRLVGYACGGHPDEVTDRLRSHCDEWHDLAPLSADAAARRIRGDRIDILVDLAGHTGGGRPLIFARRPAPVQVAWLGYPDTTGLDAMDYRFTDAEADPEGESDRHHSERLLRLAGGFLCFAPDPASPDPGPLPARANGFVTFGCFNNFAKASPEVLALWARLLEEVPGSRLVLKAHALGSESAARGVREFFAGRGVDAARLTVLGPEQAAASHLARYREVDVALDTFPYHGTTTTCEALWMGVPVVTLAGRAHVSRVGASLLHRVGLDALIASDGDGYVAAARRLAGDAGGLSAMREGMRPRLLASPLLDAKRFAREVEAAYARAWNAWVDAHA